MEGNKKKYARTTQTQLNWYVEFLKDNSEILHSKRKDVCYQRKMWSKIARQLNALHGPEKSPKKWKDSLRNWMKQLRFRARRHKAERGGTGSAYTGDHLTEFEERALAIFGEPVAAAINDIAEYKSLKSEYTKSPSTVSSSKLLSPSLSFEAITPTRSPEATFLVSHNLSNFIDEISNESVHSTSFPANEHSFKQDIHSTLMNIQSRISAIEANHESFRMEIVETLNTILERTTSIDNFIRGFVREREKKSTIYSPVDGSPLEDFDDLKKIFPIKTTQQLQAIEQQISDNTYQNRLVRFLKTKFTMNGYVNGGTFFNQVIRFLTHPNLLHAYSWKGYKQNGVEHTSFQMKHKIFVEFIYRIVRLADVTKTNENVDEFFSIIFRF